MYTDKMSIEIGNIPKEKFDKLRDDVMRLIFANGLIIDDDETGYVEVSYSGEVCGIDIVLT